jgi:hypothetical protein
MDWSESGFLVDKVASRGGVRLFQYPLLIKFPSSLQLDESSSLKIQRMKMQQGSDQNKGVSPVALIDHRLSYS